LAYRPTPPTDSELYTCGLLFHAKPPSFVAKQLLDEVEAVKSGRSPRKYLQPPSDVEQAVNNMKAKAYHFRNSSSNNYEIKEKDVQLNPYLLSPNKVIGIYKGSADKVPKPLFYNTGQVPSTK
jgi:hypothetical protein